MPDRNEPEVTLPNIVYHYTSLSAMMEIFRTQTLWATHFAYLNDVSERSLYLSLADGLQSEFSKPSFVRIFGQDDSSGEIESPILTGPQSVDDGPFVTSFSREADALYHWRSYCPPANGVCIGFRTDCLQRAEAVWRPVREGATRGILDFIAPCVFRPISYINDQDAEAVRASMRLAKERTGWELAALAEQEGFPDEEEWFWENVKSEASFFKHKGFESEMEYRLLLPSLYFQTHLLKFRCTRSSMTPYVEVHIPHSKDAEQIRSDTYRWDAVADIVIGPTPNTDLTLKAVQALCISIGLLNASIRSSKLPYRDW